MVYTRHFSFPAVLSLSDPPFLYSSLSLVSPSSTVLSLWSPLPLQFSLSDLPFLYSFFFSLSFLKSKCPTDIFNKDLTVECHNTLLLCMCILWCKVVKVYSKSLTALVTRNKICLPCQDFVFWATGCHSSRNVLNFARLFRGTPKVSTSVTKQSNNINYIKTIQ